jgi:ribokinase
LALVVKRVNEGVAIASLGGMGELLGAVGRDVDGELYLDNLRSRGVDVPGVAVLDGVETGVAIVLVDGTGENVIIVDAGANGALDPGFVREHVRSRRAAVTLAQLEVPVAALEAAAAALPAEETLILNPAPMLPDPTALATLLARTDVLVPNRKELGQLAGRDEPRTLDDVDACIAHVDFKGAVVVTLGRDGAAVYEPGICRRHHAAPAVESVDTSGAGDAFCGALALALSRGATLDDAARWAVQVASRSTLCAGAQMPVDFSAPALHLAGRG